VFDWDTIHIIGILVDEGRLEVPSEEQVYAVLGLQKKDESEKKEMKSCRAGCSARNEYDDNVATISIFQQLSVKRQLFDRNTPVMEPKKAYCRESTNGSTRIRANCR
jgi:hypothetical protein